MYVCRCECMFVCKYVCKHDLDTLSVNVLMVYLENER